jgi:hypothetical protein
VLNPPAFHECKALSKLLPVQQSGALAFALFAEELLNGAVKAQFTIFLLHFARQSFNFKPMA